MNDIRKSLIIDAVGKEKVKNLLFFSLTVL